MNEPNAKAPLTQRVNLRMIFFFAIVLLLIGWPVYGFISESLTHGIHDRGAYKEVNLKALGCFDFDRANSGLADVPAEYRALDGKKVLLEGEIYDRLEAREMTAWELVYNVQICCLGGPPQVQERVYCTTAPGQSFTRTTSTHHKILGTLHVTVHRTRLPDGSLGAVDEVYHMDVQSVE